MFNTKRLAIPFLAVSTLFAIGSSVQAEPMSHGNQPYGYYNNGYNNTPWSSSWMPWNMGNNNGYGNNTPWSGSWMPWNSNGNNNWGPFDGMMNGMGDGDMALDFNFKLSAKGSGRSKTAANGYHQGYLSNGYNNYPYYQNAGTPTPVAPAKK